MKEYTDAEKTFLREYGGYPNKDLGEITRSVEILLQGLSSETQKLAENFYPDEIYGAEMGLSFLYRRIIGDTQKFFLYPDGSIEYDNKKLKSEAAILEIARFSDEWNYDTINKEIIGPSEGCKDLAYFLFKAATEQLKLFRNFLVTNVSPERLTLKQLALSEKEDDALKRWKK